MTLLLVILVAVLVVIVAVGGLIVFLQNREEKTDTPSHVHSPGQPPGGAPTPTDSYSSPNYSDSPALPANSPLPGQASASGFQHLTIGSNVSYDNKNWTVSGLLSFNEEGYQWQEFLLQTDSDTVWLCVDNNASSGTKPETSVYRPVDTAGLQPGAPSLTFNQDSYNLNEKGHAHYTAQGSTDTPASGTANYYDYHHRSNGTRLSFEQFGDTSWNVSQGVVIPSHELTV